MELEFTFTLVCNLIFFCACYTQNSFLVCVALCNALGALVSFSLAPMYDPTVYPRMRQRKGWSIVPFFLGHVLVHIVPTIILYQMLPPEMNAKHEAGGLAALIHVGWGYYVSGGTWVFDKYYVTLPAYVWRQLFGIAILVELLSPTVLFWEENLETHHNWRLWESLGEEFQMLEHGPVVRREE